MFRLNKALVQFVGTTSGPTKCTLREGLCTLYINCDTSPYTRQYTGKTSTCSPLVGPGIECIYARAPKRVSGSLFAYTIYNHTLDTYSLDTYDPESSIMLYI
jgi:hypothetical protein